MDDSVIPEPRQLLAEEISLTLRSLMSRMDAMQVQVEGWTRSTEKRFVSYNR